MCFTYSAYGRLISFFCFFFFAAKKCPRSLIRGGGGGGGGGGRGKIMQGYLDMSRAID